MNSTWLSFPLRLGICIILLVLAFSWQYQFDLGAFYYKEAHSHQYVDNAYGLALNSYQLSLHYRPEHAPTIYQEGLVLMNLGRIDEAIVAFETSLNLGFEPRWKVLNPLIRMLVATGQEAEAAEYQAELDNE